MSLAAVLHQLAETMGMDICNVLLTLITLQLTVLPRQLQIRLLLLQVRFQPQQLPHRFRLNLQFLVQHRRLYHQDPAIHIPELLRIMEEMKMAMLADTVIFHKCHSLSNSLQLREVMSSTTGMGAGLVSKSPVKVQMVSTHHVFVMVRPRQ